MKKEMVYLQLNSRGYGSKFDLTTIDVVMPKAEVPEEVIEAIAEIPREKDEWGLPIYKKEQVIIDFIDSLPIEMQEKFYNNQNDMFAIDREDWIRDQYKVLGLTRTNNVIEVNFGQKKSANKSTAKTFK